MTRVYLERPTQAHIFNRKMMKLVLMIMAVVAMTGCVVVPYNQRYDVVMYPQYGGAYVWDYNTSSFYFVVNSNRYYMQKGWHPGYGYPPGHYRRY